MSCRVTVVGTRRRIDADLPDSIPVAELLVDVVGLLGESQNGVAAEWGLVRVGGARLDPELSLADQGVAEGTMLFLRDVTAAPIAPDVDDFAGHVAAMVDVQKGRWSQAMPAALLVWIAAGALAAGGVVVLVAGDASSRATAGLLGALIPSLAALVVVRVMRRNDLAEVLMVSSLPSWADAGAGVAGLAGASAPLLLAFGLAALALGAIATGAIAGLVALAAADGVFEATALPAVVVGVGAAFGAGLPQAAAVVVVLELAILAMLPLMNMRLVRIASEQAKALERRLAEGRRVAVASHTASAVVIVAACSVLVLSGGWFARGLVAATAIATLLRARHYRFAGEVVPLLVAGVVCLLLLELPFVAWLALGARGTAGLALLSTGDAAVLVAAAVLVRRWDLPVAIVRWLHPVEFVAVALTVPLALGALGLYGAVGQYASSLR